MGIHRDVIKSSKFTDSTVPSVNIKRNLTFWNEKRLQLPKIDND
jgi:hypothetical protein